MAIDSFVKRQSAIEIMLISPLPLPDNDIDAWDRGTLVNNYYGIPADSPIPRNNAIQGRLLILFGDY